MPTFYPKKLFTVSGKNMNFVERVMFGEEEVSPLAYLGTTGVSGIVPSAAYTNDVILETSDEVLNLGVANVVLDSASQVVASGLLSDYVSGKAGDLIEISGENFYQITDIKFGGVNSPSFSVLSPAAIEAVVPENAHYVGVSVFSSLRTGLNGSTSEASGITNNKFVPIPEITALSSGQLCSGETLKINGASFSGVTGISINSIELDSFQVNTSKEVQGIIPSGNVRGVPNLLLQSGVSLGAPSVLAFKPLARITGVQDGKLLGSSVRVSGENFTSGILYSGIELDKYLVSIGGETGLFTLTNDKLLEGTVPTGLSVSVSGDVANVGAGSFKISSHAVSAYSSSYPEQYPSQITFTPGIGNPSITSVFPETGIGGDVITIEGTDFFGLTGINLGNVGMGTETPYLSTADPGKKVTFTIPTSNNYDTTGTLLGITLSGYFGYTAGTHSLNILGSPGVSEIYPVSDVLPGSTGSVYGSRLHSGITDLYLYDTSLNPQYFITDLEISGYGSNSDQITFTYPNSFNTGVSSYRIRTKNRRGGTTTVITTIDSPVLSGFSPLSGEYLDTVVISGYFEGIVPNGLSVGDFVVDSYTQNSTTGIDMTIPYNSLSDVINISTSGGFTTSSKILGVSPSKPIISEYYLGEGNAPASFNQDQVFSAGDSMTISGKGVNLTTGVLFSGESDSFVVGNFIRKSPSSLVLSVPAGINSGSGSFIVEDFLSRQTESPYDINITRLRDFSNYLLPGDTFHLSGENVSGLDVRFQYATGGYISVPALTNSVSNNIDEITVSVPSGISYGRISVSGRDNPEAGVSVGDFVPLAVITGVAGFGSSNEVATGDRVTVTGVNCYDTGNPYLTVGISGTGNAAGTPEFHFYHTLFSGFSTGLGLGTDTFYQSMKVNIDTSFIGTGRLFLTNPWDTGVVDMESYLSSESYSYVQNQMDFFPDEFVIEGTRVNATGYGPLRGITGSNVEISGEGFSAVTGVGFEVPTGYEGVSSCYYAGFTINSDNKITATVPDRAIEVKGEVNLVLSGGTNDTVGPFEVLLDASVVEFEINNQNDIPASSSNVTNFTNRETVNGVVFLVTRTKFPDGTTTIVSSVPEL